MERAFVILAVACCFLVQYSSAVTRKSEPNYEDEIKFWREKGLPEMAGFVSTGNKPVAVNLFQEPVSASKYSASIFGGSNIEKNIQYYLFTRENPSGVKFSKNSDSINAAGFNPERKTKVVVHGFTCDISCNIFKRIVPNLLQVEDVNVIAVDWGKLSKFPFYITARSNVPKVGKAVASLLDFLVDNHGMNMKDVHAMGHSLGGQVVGNIGKNVNKSEKLQRITGLDPAGPLFLLTGSERLSPSDGVVVDVIHTCGGLAGYLGPLGKYDFYVDGGQRPQPTCGVDLIGFCSHERSMEVFADSIVNPDSFPAIYCKSASNAENEDCTAGNDSPPAYMGYHLRASELGSYEVKTVG